MGQLARLANGTLWRALLTGACLLAAGCSPQDDGTPDTAPAPSVRAGAQDASQEATSETLQAVRQVIPGAAVHAPPPGSMLERLPAPPVEPLPPRPVNLGIVVVEEATRLRTRRGMVELAGTRAVDGDALCSLPDGRAPLCAVLARAAMRRHVGQRSVACTLAPRAQAGQDHVAPCRAGDSDLALWVVAEGWAFVAENADAALQEAQASARAAGRGLWPIMAER